jgi:ATP synthase protein I
MVPAVFAVPTAPDGRFDAIPMDEDNHPPSLEDLDARLRKARGKARPANAAEGDDAPAGGWGQAMRVGLELVSGLAVGVGIGWLLDEWLGTRPWLMVLFFFLGAGAGMLNVYRSVAKLGYGVGYGGAEAEEDAENEKEDGKP